MEKSFGVPTVSIAKAVSLDYRVHLVSATPFTKHGYIVGSDAPSVASPGVCDYFGASYWWLCNSDQIERPWWGWCDPFENNILATSTKCVYMAEYNII